MAKRKPRIVYDVIAETPADYRWLLRYCQMTGCATPISGAGFTVADEGKWRQALSIAKAVERKA